jgi:ABC-2 type transport system permease protein
VSRPRWGEARAATAAVRADLRDLLVEIRWQLARGRRSLVGWAVGLAAVAGIYIPFYPAMGGAQLQGIVDTLPPELIAALGYDRIGTPEGYLTSTVFGLLGPALMLAFAISAAARTIAGEEQEGRLELAVSAPVRREVLLAGRIIALHARIAAAALVTFLVSAGLSAAVGMEVGVSGIAAGALGLNLLAIAFGTVTLAAGAATGRRSVAVAVGAGTAVASFVADALSGIVPWGGWLERASPFSWYLAGDPVARGVPVAGFTLLAALTFVAWGGAVLGFRRRDVGV